MRLTSDEIYLITEALNSFTKGEESELRLYGSRVNDSLKGGDIDLLLLTENDKFALELREKKHLILAAIKKNIGDRKIDLAIAAKQDVQQDVFLKMIFPESVLLKKFYSK